MKTLFLETYWPAIVAVAIGVIIAISANSRLKTRPLRAGLAIVGLGVALALLSFFVKTPRERVTVRTKEMAAAVSHGDWKTVESLLDPDARIYGWKGASTIVRGGKAYAEESGLKSATVTDVQVQDEEPDIVVIFSVRTDHDAKLAAFTVPSTWKLRWIETDRGWVIHDIEAESVHGLSTDQIRARFNQ